MASKFDLQKHHRCSIRLPNYDYAQAGVYYVTILTWHPECLFGEVVKGEVVALNHNRSSSWKAAWRVPPTEIS